MIRVLLVEDQRLAQRMIAQYVQSASDRYTLVDAIRCADDALSICDVKNIDLILMDVITEQSSSGLKAAKKIKRLHPNIKIIIITSMPELNFIQSARDAKVESFWYKNTHNEDLLRVMDATVEGQSIYPDTSPVVLIGDAHSTDFTPREREVLYWIVKGSTVSMIAKELHISETTVRYHLDNLKMRTGCKTKLELAIKAVETGLILPNYE